MNLKDYLYYKRVSYDDFARVIGVTKGHLQNIISGTRWPSTKLCSKIELHTAGEVTLKDLTKGKPKRKQRVKGVKITQIQFNELLASIKRIAQPGQLPENFGEIR
jgi:DNA-binding transcriptional regulator YdaS (Cro superfamily)